MFQSEFIYIYAPYPRTVQIQRDRRVTDHKLLLKASSSLTLGYPSHVTKAFGSDKRTAARLYCLSQPLTNPSLFLYEGESFHITDCFHRCYIFQQTSWLANPAPFSSCSTTTERKLCQGQRVPRHWTSSFQGWVVFVLELLTPDCETLGRENSFPGYKVFSPTCWSDTPQRTIEEFSAHWTMKSCYFFSVL